MYLQLVKSFVPFVYFVVKNLFLFYPKASSS
jgi:hypothetical protein